MFPQGLLSATLVYVCREEMDWSPALKEWLVLT